jgi:hypothetical protein
MAQQCAKRGPEGGSVHHCSDFMHESKANIFDLSAIISAVAFARTLQRF